jgi:hypothetical protein
MSSIGDDKKIQKLSKKEKSEKYKKKFKKGYMEINKMHLNKEEYDDFYKEQKDIINKDISQNTEKKPYSKYDDLFEKVSKMGKEYGKAYLRLITNFGNLNFEIYCSQTPVTSYNFLELCEQNEYNNIPFHRLIPDFMVFFIFFL